MSHAIVLLSGGIDSTTCLAEAVQKFDLVTPINIQYGQQTEDLELQQAEASVEYFQEVGDAELEDLEVIDYHDVFSHFAGGVASDRDSFVNDDGSMEEDDGRSTGYVPMRNLHLIATGSAIADVRGADAVYHGAQMGDSADYPDCRPSFMFSVQEAVSQSLAAGDNISIETPLLTLEKTEVIQRGEKLDVPWEYTYSCYEAVEDLDEPEPCGACPACVERAEAFKEAGVVDPFGTVEAVKTAEAVESD